MTDFRALCAELVDCLEKANWPLRHKTVFGICLDNARAALAEPEPQGPSDEELKQLLFDNYRGVIEFVCDVEEEAHVMADSHVQFARAVLARWGRPTSEENFDG